MNKWILFLLFACCRCIGAAQAQDQNTLEVFPQLGHSQEISSVAFSPDGKMLVSGSNDRTVKLWDVASGRELRTLKGHLQGVGPVAFAPDGSMVASGSHDDTVRLWDVRSGRVLKVFNGLLSWVTSIAFSPDGRTLASASHDGTVKLWDVASARELRTLSGHSNEVESLSFSPDGKSLASGSDDATIRLWDLTSGFGVQTLAAGHSGGVNSVAFSPDGATLASGNSDNTITLWDVASGRTLRSLNAHPAARSRAVRNSVAFSPDGRTLALLTLMDGSIQLWDVASGRALRTIGRQLFMTTMAFSPDGSKLASGGYDNAIRLWDSSSGRELRTLSGHSDGVLSAAFSPDGATLAWGSGDSTIKLWDVTSGRALRSFRGHTGQVNAVAFSPDGKSLVSGADDDTVKLWDLTSGGQLRSLDGHSEAVQAVAISPDGTTLASGGHDNSIKLWDASSGREVRTLRGQSGWISSVAFSADGRRLASFDSYRPAGAGGHIRVWDVASGRTLRTFGGPSDDIESFAFSPDGTKLACAEFESGETGSEDHVIRLWDVASGLSLGTLRGHSDAVEALVFSPDGTRLASGSLDGTIKLWDVASDRELRTFSNSGGQVSTMVFSPDGKTLASGSDDGAVRLWTVSDGSERVSLIGFDDGSSIAVTPDGYFDSSSAQAEQNLNVRIGNRVLGIASFREGFYRPDLVKASIVGQPLSQFGSISNEKLPPFVDVADLPSSTNDPKINVKVHLADGGGGIGTVRLFLNGAAVRQDSAPTAKGDTTRSYSVPLVDGDNEVSAVGFNADGTVQSNDATTFVAAKLPPSQPVLHAVIVGIQDFKNKNYHLAASVADAQLFDRTLEEHVPAGFGSPDVMLLVTPKETDKQHLIDALKAMQPRVGPNDVFIFYFASHGEVRGGKYYLITSNVGTYEGDHLKTDALGSQELAGLLANIAATRKLVIIDACHSQFAGDAMQLALASQGMNTQAATTILSRGTGLTSLSASAVDQEAGDANDKSKGQSPFTLVLVNGMLGKAGAVTKAPVGKDGKVNTFDLADYIDAEVPLIATEQNPTVNKSGAPFPVTQVH